jgi:starch-binding outer membrane protein, SusD/RagB family
MKTIRNTILVLPVCLIIFLSSCSDSWLDPAPLNQLITQDSTFIVPENAEKFVNACYNQLLQWEQSSFSWIGVSSITSDDADKGSDPGDTGTDKHIMDDLTYTSEGLSIGEVWVGNYNGVSRCNQAIANVPKYDIEEGFKTRLIAEAKFLRAFYFFNLVRCYGDVPLVDGLIDANNPADIDKVFTRAPKASVYAFIESDLNDAIIALPIVDDYEAKDIGRATKGAAMALLAKVSLYQQNWQDVVDLTDNIINGSAGNYALVPDYSTIWREAGENSTESLFEVQGRGVNPIAAIQQYSEIQGARGTNAIKYSDGTAAIGGWGFNTPSVDLDNAYEPGDLRRAATIMHKGDTLWDGAILQNGAANNMYNYKAYVSKRLESFNGNSSTTSKNIRILRMGEVYLLNAEAANELGNTSKAQSSLNEVRHRAGLGDTQASNQADLRDAIWKERRVELAMEHDRFFDLVRQGRAGEVLRAQGKNFVDGKNEVFPIPQKQIDASLGRYTQNPGY